MPEEDEDEGTPFGQGDNIFGTSKTAKGLFDESEDEEKESSGGFAAAVSGKKSNEEPSEDADKESLHSSSKCIVCTYVLYVVLSGISISYTVRYSCCDIAV